MQYPTQMAQIKVVPILALLAVVVWLGFRKTGADAGSAELSANAVRWLEAPLVADEEFVEPWDEPGKRPDRIALTWSDDPATTLSVTWRTGTSVEEGMAMVALAGASPGFGERAATFDAAVEYLDLTSVDGESVRAHYHSVTFRNLEPGTLYAYRVGDGEIWSEWFHARTADREATPFSFLYFGDAQNDLHNLWSRTIRAAFAEEPDARFMIHAGDLVNAAHRNTEWGEWFESGGWLFGMLPTIAIPGNHEYRGYSENDEERKLSKLWRPQFSFPENGIPGLEETSYVIDYQGVRFIGLNSNREILEQSAWIDSVLTNNPHRWTIATFHHPVFSSSGRRDNPLVRETWKPLFDKHRVDLVLQGHDHTYARGRVLNIPAGLNSRDELAGTVYVNSVSGPKMYEVKDNRWDDYGAAMERSAENTQLFQVIHIDGDRLRYEAITATGDLYDSFELIKSDNGPNTFVSRIAVGVPERTHKNTSP